MWPLLGPIDLLDVARGQMYIARKAQLDISVNLFDALNANDGTKFNFQELASNEHICSVEGHVVTLEAKGHASEYRVADEGNVLLMADAPELLCFDTKYIAGGPNPIHNVQPFQLQEPKEHLFVPVVRTLEPHISELRERQRLRYRWAGLECSVRRPR